MKYNNKFWDRGDAYTHARQVHMLWARPTGSPCNVVCTQGVSQWGQARLCCVPLCACTVSQTSRGTMQCPVSTQGESMGVGWVVFCTLTCACCKPGLKGHCAMSCEHVRWANGGRLGSVVHSCVHCKPNHCDVMCALGGTTGVSWDM